MASCLISAMLCQEGPCWGAEGDKKYHLAAGRPAHVRRSASGPSAETGRGVRGRHLVAEGRGVRAMKANRNKLETAGRGACSRACGPARPRARAPQHQSRVRPGRPCVPPSHPCFVGIRKQTELTRGPWQQFPGALTAARERIALLCVFIFKMKVVFRPRVPLRVFPRRHWKPHFVAKAGVSLGNRFSLKSAVDTRHYYTCHKHQRAGLCLGYSHRCCLIGATCIVFEKHIVIHN